VIDGCFYLVEVGDRRKVIEMRRDAIRSGMERMKEGDSILGCLDSSLVACSTKPTFYLAFMVEFMLGLHESCG